MWYGITYYKNIESIENFSKNLTAILFVLWFWDKDSRNFDFPLIVAERIISFRSFSSSWESRMNFSSSKRKPISRSFDFEIFSNLMFISKEVSSVAISIMASLILLSTPSNSCFFKFPISQIDFCKSLDQFLGEIHPQFLVIQYDADSWYQFDLFRTFLT